MSLQRNASDDGTADLPEELLAFARFCARLTLSDGRPFILEPFQLRMLRDYFEGVLETLILLSKKNGKTTLLAALGLYHVGSWRDAECVIGAASRDQASLIFEQARGFVVRSAWLQKHVVVRTGFREIRAKKGIGRIRVLAADVDTADGVIPTLALVDELGRHKKADLYGVFRDGLGPRDGQMLGISAAGDHETSPLGVMRAAARKLPTTREGHYLYARADDGSFALHEWSLDDSDDLDDMDVVKEVNPASWQTKEKLSLRHGSPSMLPWQWARFACGIWVSAESWWLSPEDWTATETDEQLEPGDIISLGFDGSRFHDATALVGCRLEDGLTQLLGLWEQPEGAKDWEVRSSEVDAVLAETMETFRVVRAYCDPPLWQSEIDAWAREYGEEVVLRYWTNRSRFMIATERFRTDLAQRVFPHHRHARLTAHVLSAQLVEARGGYWLTKGHEKIDAAIASVLAYEARCDAVAAGLGRNQGRVMSF